MLAFFNAYIQLTLQSIDKGPFTFIPLILDGMYKYIVCPFFFFFFAVKFFPAVFDFSPFCLNRFEFIMQGFGSDDPAYGGTLVLGTFDPKTP